MIVYSKHLFIYALINKKSSNCISRGEIKLVEVLKSPISKLRFLVHYYANNQGREVSLLSKNDSSQYSLENLWGFHIKDVVFFWWESKTDTLYYKLESKGSLELFTYWLLHVALPMYFTVEEQYTFLHAGAVEVGGKPILFLAESFGGKSTMTDFFIRHGHIMVSDDKVGTYEENGTFFSVPSYPYHRPYRKAEDMGKYVENFAKQPKPIHALYSLERTEKNSDVEIEEIKGIDKFYILRLSSQFNLSFQKKKRFEYLIRMSKSVPMYRIKIPWDIDRLTEVYSVIINHIDEI